MKQAFELQTARWSAEHPAAAVTQFLARPAIDPGAELVARDLLDKIRAEGDAAVLRLAAEFDTPGLKREALRVGEEEMAAARAAVDEDFKVQAREADRRIFAFASAGKRKDWQMSTHCGGTLGEKYVPLDRVGVYIPGGTAPLASTALMTATLARAAGVAEIVACTPADKHGKVNPYVLFALEVAGVKEIYRIGGVQAVGAMAYGTETIPKVQKIVGPGNAYVAAAKKLVYGDVSLDSVAGPSEIAILADHTACAEHVAADLLSQAEHGTGLEKALLVTTESALIPAVEEALHRQAAKLSRLDRTLPVLREGVMAVQVDTLADGIELINRFAAEHLELLVAAPRDVCGQIRAAGAIFLGEWTPESAGDFAAGPSHVLPTGGAAAMFSGLTVDDFMRRSSVLELTKEDLAEVLPVIEAFGRVEGLDGHVRSAQIRFES